MISFARGAPAPECLDAELLADSPGPRSRPIPQCSPAVPAAATARSANGSVAGKDSPPARVIVTNGGLQGFVFYAEELLAERPGRVLVEAPTYDRPLKILARLGADAVPVAMDGEGLDPDALERELAARRDELLYTIPTFQNPSGRTLSTERRRASSSSRPRTACRCSRTTRTASSATRARRPRRCTSSREASSSPTRPRSRRRSRPASASAGSSRRPGSRRGSRREPSRTTSRRRSSPRRRCTS